jgi:hypothetical protein
VQKNATKPMTATHHATLDALSNDQGIIEDKPLKKNSRGRRNHLKLVESAPVLIARAPVEPWICDSCAETGRNWPQMQRHTEDTKHTSYSKR